MRRIGTSVGMAAFSLAPATAVAQGRAPGKDTVLEVLRERYARGEINHGDFEARRCDLGA